jgi:AraC-like DNA-binding protein
MNSRLPPSPGAAARPNRVAQRPRPVPDPQRPQRNRGPSASAGPEPDAAQPGRPVTDVVPADASWTVFAAPVNAVLQAAEQLGADTGQLLKRAAIDPALLQQPDARIPVGQFFSLYAHAERATRNPDIGLIVGRIIYLKGMNLQLYMGSVCQRFRDYLNLMPSVLKLRGDLGEMRVHPEGEFIRLQWQPLQPESGRHRFLSDEMLAASAAIVNSLCVLPIPVRRAHFTYPEPKDSSSLRSQFGAELDFGQPVSCLYLDRQSLDYPMLQQDYQDNANLVGDYGRLLMDDTADHFLASMRQSIARLLPEGELSIDAVAAELNVSRRTLQRRLADRETHFQQLVQEVRGELACSYLGDKRLAITEIAFLLGYADHGSFSNAFKSWFGRSPSEYRGRG